MSMKVLLMFCIASILGKQLILDTSVAIKRTKMPHKDTSSDYRNLLANVIRYADSEIVDQRVVNYIRSAIHYR